MDYLFKYYAGLYDGFMKKFKLDSNEEMLKTIGEVKDKKILDIGGGTGTLADLLQRAGAKVVLVDPSVQMTAIAKKKNSALEIYTSTLQQMNKEILARQFDIVIIRDALHHVRDQKEIIRLSGECLNKAGILIISEFNWNSIRTKMIWCFETLCFERCRMFTKATLIALCSPYFENGKMTSTNEFEIIYKGRKRESYEENKTIS